jgi:hypothetical protein
MKKSKKNSEEIILFFETPVLHSKTVKKSRVQSKNDEENKNQ